MTAKTVRIVFADGSTRELPESAFPAVLEVDTTRGRIRYRLTLHYNGDRVKSVTLS